MKTKQTSVIVAAEDYKPTQLLNSYLDDGWKVVSTASFVPNAHSSYSRMLVIIEKEVKD